MNIAKRFKKVQYILFETVFNKTIDSSKIILVCEDKPREDAVINSLNSLGLLDAT